MNRFVKYIYAKYRNKRASGVAIICLMVAISMLFFYTKQSNYQNASLTDVMKINDEAIIIYLAKDDCPECQKMDKLLDKNKNKLMFPVYRIETTREKNQELLKQLIAKENISSVPTFLLKNEQSIETIEAKTTEKNISFQKLTGN